MKKLILMAANCKLAIVIGLLMGVVLAASAQFSGPESIQTEYEELPAFAYDWKLPRYAEIKDGRYLVIDIPKDAESAQCMLSAPIDMRQFANRGMRASVKAKAHELTPRKGGQCVFGFSFTDPATGDRQYVNSVNRDGDFPDTDLSAWVSFTGPCADSGKLRLGLWNMTGRIEFDLKTLKLGVYDGLFRKINDDYKVRYPARVMSRQPVRGVMSPVREITEDDMATLHRWGARLLRFQINRLFSEVGANSDLSTFNAFVDKKLDHLESVVLPLAKKYGLLVCIDLHATPGGRLKTKELAIFHDQRFLDCYIDIWRRIARRFKGCAQIYGYDLVNEPIQFDRVPKDMDYWSVQRRTAEAIREIDPDVTIVVESNLWDSPATFAYLSPLRMDNVIYQVHMYQPGAFTHQGMFGSPKGPAYPDRDRGWNRDYLRRLLEPVRKFQLAHDAKIFVGEFSAVAWAPGAGEYIRDAISIFNEYGWDWAYHAFRESDAWSIEHEGEDSSHMRRSDDNPRRHAVLDGFRGVDSTVRMKSAAGGDWDRTIAEFPVRDGEADDTARVQRAIDATPSGVLYFPDGVYRISSTLSITNRCSLRLHKSATLRAVAKMPYVIKIHNQKGRFTGDRLYDYNHFVKGGRIDGNGLASCMALDGFWHYTLRDVSFLNGRDFGLRLHSELGGCELMAYNLYFITVKSGLSGNTAVYTTGSDSHFTDCVVVDYTVGFRNGGGSNRYTRCHVWGGPLPPAKAGEEREMLKDSVNFWIEGQDTVLRDCYADTGKTGFRIGGMVQLFGCRYYNNRGYKLDGITVFDHRRGTALISGCHFMSGNTPDIRLYRGAEGTAGQAVWRDCQCTGAFKDADGIPGLLDFEVDQEVATADEWEFVPATYVFSSPAGEYRRKDCTGFDFPVSRRRMNGRFPKTGPGTTLVVRARATTPETKTVEIALLHKTGKVWGALLPLTMEWRDIRIPLANLRYFSQWAGMPPKRKDDRPDVRLLTDIKFCFGKWICADSLDAEHGLEIESIRIVGR